MILSFRHRFIFVRPRKVAGTSVEMVLSTICGGRDIVPPMIAVDERIRQRLGGFSGNYGANSMAEVAYARLTATASSADSARLIPPPSRYGAHMSLAEIATVSGVEPASFRTIMIVRNPYARIISALHMRSHFDAYRRDAAMPGVVDRLARSLDEARERGGLAGLKIGDLCGSGPDELLRMETLPDDLERLSRTLHVVLPPLPHAKRGPDAGSIDPKSVFRRDQIDWINAAFAAEFAAFDYPMV